MRPTATYPDVLEFLPKAAEHAVGRGGAALAKARVVLDVFSDALSAAHDYDELTSRGLAPGAAAQRVFADHFGSR